jgi:hypothetical protein
MGFTESFVRPMKFSAVLWAVLLLGVQLKAQDTFGSIVGTVTDPSGAVVPAAKVVLTNTGTAEAKAIETDNSGNYQFRNLLPGFYKIEVEKAGFARVARDGIQVLVQASVRSDVVMRLGDVGQTVEVSAQALALQTESATLSHAVEGRNVTEMPLNGRNVYNLIALVPGVVMEGGAPQIGGGMANQNVTYVDGVSVNTGYFNQTGAAPSQDAVQEFRVQTNSTSAEFGRFAGGVISLSTKSGTNDFHGTLYEFLRNRVLNANTFFSNRAGLARPPFTQNQYGGNLGGPIKRNKTFFFGSFEGFALRTATTYVLNAPTPKMLNGDFSEFMASGGIIYDAKSSTTGTNRVPFSGNVIPLTRLDPTAVIMSKLSWNTPNQPGLVNNWVNNASSGSNNGTYNVRVDYNLSDKQRLFARFNYANPVPVLVSPYANSQYTAGTRANPYYTVIFGDTYSLSPSTIFDIRLSYLRTNNNRYPSQLGIDLTTVGWPDSYNTQTLTRTLPQICMTNYDFAGGYCQGNPQSVILVHNNDFAISPSLTTIRGRHTLKFGAEIRRNELNYLQANNNSGNFTFTSAMTAQNGLNPGIAGNQFASFMLGYGASGNLTQNAATSGLELYQAYYINDTFVVNRRLTVTAGLRWEGLGAFYERHGRQTVLLPGIQNPLVPNLGVVALVKSPYYSNKASQPYPKNLFSPHLGLAYRASNKTVIRTGGSINFLPTDGAIGSSPFGSPVNTINTPWVPSLDGGLTPFATLNNPFPTGINSPPQRDPRYEQTLLGLAVSSMVPSNPRAYTIQYNFSIERELPGGAILDVAYASLKGVHLYQTRQFNQIADQYLALGTQLVQNVPNPYFGKVATGTLANPTVARGQLLRPFPQYTGYAATAAGAANSRYHALQVKLEKRFKSGGTLLASYTHSKLISDTEQLANFASGVGNQTYQNFNNLRAERSLAGFDTPENLVVSYVYDLPAGKGRRFLRNLPGPANALISGWGINGISMFTAGTPLSFLTVNNTTNSFGGNQRPNVVAGCEKSIEGSAQSRVNAWFNTACFTAPAAFTFGNESRTDPNLRTAGIANWDFATFKDTQIRERFALQFRAEIFNLFNRVQFGAPNQTQGGATFGVVNTQAGNQRLVQLALRLKF